MAEEENVPAWKKRDRRVSSKMAQFMETAKVKTSKPVAKQEPSSPVVPKSPKELPVPKRSLDKQPLRDAAPVKPVTPNKVVTSEIPTREKRKLKIKKKMGRPRLPDWEERQEAKRKKLAEKAAALEASKPDEVQPPPAKKLRLIIDNSSTSSMTLPLPSAVKTAVTDEVDYIPPSPETPSTPGLPKNISISPLEDLERRLPKLPRVFKPLEPSPAVIPPKPKVELPQARKLVFIKNNPNISIKFLKPKIHTLPLNNNSQATRPGSSRPSSTSSSSSNGRQSRESNNQENLKIDTRQSDYLDPNYGSPQSSPSVLGFTANLPKRMLESIQPNVRFVLVNQNGQLLYPTTELEESSATSEPDLSSPSPTYRVFEPCPNYTLTVL